MLDKMPERGVINSSTALYAYVKAGKISSTFELFNSRPKRNVVSWSTMILSYGKAGIDMVNGILPHKIRKKKKQSILGFANLVFL